MSLSISAAYDEYESASREARQLIESSEVFRNVPESHDLAYRALAEAQAMASTWALGSPLDQPRIQELSYWHNGCWTFGSPCQDFRYGQILVDGRDTYRLKGRIGLQKLTLVQAHSHLYGHPESKELGQYDIADFVDPDGRFDVEVSAGVDPVRGIALDAGSQLNFLFVRRVVTYPDDDPGEMWIERVDDPDPGAIEADSVDERLLRAADLLRYLAKGWAIGLQDIYLATAGGMLNTVSYRPGEEMFGLAGSPFARYGFGVFDIAPDEALIMEWTPTPSAYWSIQAGALWCHGLDFCYYQTDLNMASAVVDDDGLVRAVFSATDPGVANWIDIRGHHRGLMTVRAFKPEGYTNAPVMTMSKLPDVPKRLPRSTVFVSPQERRLHLLERRRRYRVANRS